MGGATVGFKLAEAGYRVLFIEKGYSVFSPTDGSIQLGSEEPQERLQNGLWPTRITGDTNELRTRFFPPLGCGVGGSTLLYSAALERFDPSDFTQQPDDWPITYDELKPYYREAEMLFKVTGTEDPLCPDSGASLLPPPLMSKCDEHFETMFKAKALHPYRVHVGFGFKAGCNECSGHICSRQCKSDARMICIEPALRTGRAHIFDNCEVLKLGADASHVREIVALRDNQQLSIRARIVVLAAGAYISPVLLLKSANNFWPRGIANDSGLVGRNLMFHISDFIAVWPRRKYTRIGPRKTLAFRDFYVRTGMRLGSVQSTGLTADYGNIVHFLKTAFDRSRWRWLRPVRPFLRVPAYLASLLFGRATIFATIMADMPYEENRVVLDENESSGFRFEYKVRDELYERIAIFRKLLKETLRPLRSFVLGQEVNLNFGHACGTCRFGTDPESSVLDANNKAHGIDNLYVVDASFMPTSGGANPSLTIAANALRVAKAIETKLKLGQDRAGPGNTDSRTSDSLAQATDLTGDFRTTAT